MRTTLPDSATTARNHNARRSLAVGTRHYCVDRAHPYHRIVAGRTTTMPTTTELVADQAETGGSGDDGGTRKLRQLILFLCDWGDQRPGLGGSCAMRNRHFEMVIRIAPFQHNPPASDRSANKEISYAVAVDAVIH
jgi:hypothetical protein